MNNNSNSACPVEVNGVILTPEAIQQLQIIQDLGGVESRVNEIDQIIEHLFQWSDEGTDEERLRAYSFFKSLYDFRKTFSILKSPKKEEGGGL